MNSGERNRCSHRLGFPIRKSPDHRLLASSRGLSQLATSFFASLRQGIHTHALSSLTIKSISNTKYSMSFFLRCFPSGTRQTSPLGSLQILVVSIARQIFDFQRSDFFDYSKTPKIIFPSSLTEEQLPSVSSHCLLVLVGLDRLELSTSPLSGVRSSHLSYRPGPEALVRPFPSRG